ncbi:hypothetical protein [Gottfriedia acidiceleris]|uniref:hypothetical protein n=1 Tax=Gottfriedia acidiceleris TaxID=371036 RepID=UPI003000EE2B
MVNLKQLDDTIKDLEIQSSRLKSLKILQDDLTKLDKKLSEFVIKQDKTNEEINKTTLKLEETSNQYKKNLQVVEEKYHQLLLFYKEQIEKANIEQERFHKIQNDDKNEMLNKFEIINNQLQNEQKHLAKIQEDLNNQLLHKVQLIGIENSKVFLETKNYLDLQLEISSKTLLNNFDNKLEKIQNFFNQLEEKMANQKKSLDQFTVSFEKAIEQNNKNQKRITWFMIIIILLVCVAIGIEIF